MFEPELLRASCSTFVLSLTKSHAAAGAIRHARSPQSAPRNRAIREARSPQRFFGDVEPHSESDPTLTILAEGSPHAFKLARRHSESDSTRAILAEGSSASFKIRTAPLRERSDTHNPAEWVHPASAARSIRKKSDLKAASLGGLGCVRWAQGRLVSRVSCILEVSMVFLAQRFQKRRCLMLLVECDALWRENDAICRQSCNVGRNDVFCRRPLPPAWLRLGRLRLDCVSEAASA